MIQILIFLNKSLFKVLSFTQIYPIAWSRDQKSADYSRSIFEKLFGIGVCEWPNTYPTHAYSNKIHLK